MDQERSVDVLWLDAVKEQAETMLAEMVGKAGDEIGGEGSARNMGREGSTIAMPMMKRCSVRRPRLTRFGGDPIVHRRLHPRKGGWRDAVAHAVHHL